MLDASSKLTLSLQQLQFSEHNRICGVRRVLLLPAKPFMRVVCSSAVLPHSLALQALEYYAGLKLQVVVAPADSINRTAAFSGSFAAMAPQQAEQA
jgi:hypothetical protein